MTKITKKYKKIQQSFDADKYYDLENAIKIVKQNAVAKFDETIEIAINMGVDPKKPEQIVRGVCKLPEGRGKNIKVAVFARGEKADEARKAGADFVGAEELVKEVENGKIGFNATIATPDVMKILGKIARKLGPRGLMPNPKLGTVTNEIETAVKDAKNGAVKYRIDKAAIVHAPIAKASFSQEKISRNAKAFFESIKAAKSSTVKANYIKKITLSSTMGAAVKVKISGILSGGGAA